MKTNKEIKEAIKVILAHAGKSQANFESNTAINTYANLIITVIENNNSCANE